MRILPHLAVLSLLLLAGCASSPETTPISLRPGMSRDDLKLFYGNPVRIAPGVNGGEDWYYRFTSWNGHPGSESGVTVGNGGVSSYTSASVEISNDTAEEPIHVSSGGYVVEPIPEGKIVRN